MIGNDIVDLRKAEKESNWRRPGYLEKLFTPEEQAMIQSAALPDQMVWLLWSMKESAYKIMSRRRNLRSFAPRKLVCRHLNLTEQSAAGQVTYEQDQYYTSSIVNPGYVYTIACEHKDDLAKVHSIISPPHSNYAYSLSGSVSHHGRYLALADLSL
ncbi:4'-phosphopantetheinyl transferase family protein [Pedobacter faecalis]|uniref:4'-phosphopantetheinyl transferase family protein n=1 Tax=Pedobacter faecalis TaxID=3041495 RepID=UPI002551A469|nr:4'-phosphopantetheinyl transferase superfamily protein [Pedobacter sp. ELA7]